MHACWLTDCCALVIILLPCRCTLCCGVYHGMFWPCVQGVAVKGLAPPVGNSLDCLSKFETLPQSSDPVQIFTYLRAIIKRCDRNLGITFVLDVPKAENSINSLVQLRIVACQRLVGTNRLLDCKTCFLRLGFLPHTAKRLLTAIWSQYVRGWLQRKSSHVLGISGVIVGNLSYDLNCLQLTHYQCKLDFSGWGGGGRHRHVLQNQNS